MSNHVQSNASVRTTLREAVVPSIMLLCIGLYVYDSLHLSAAALAFPAVLIVVILAALLYLVAESMRRTASDVSGGAEEDDETSGPILPAKPWLIVALPVIAVSLFNYLGVLIALVAMVFCGQLALSSKSIAEERCDRGRGNGADLLLVSNMYSTRASQLVYFHSAESWGVFTYDCGVIDHGYTGTIYSSVSSTRCRCRHF